MFQRDAMVQNFGKYLQQCGCIGIKLVWSNAWLNCTVWPYLERPLSLLPLSMHCIKWRWAPTKREPNVNSMTQLVFNTSLMRTQLMMQLAANIRPSFYCTGNLGNYVDFSSPLFSSLPLQLFIAGLFRNRSFSSCWFFFEETLSFWGSADCF